MEVCSSFQSLFFDPRTWEYFILMNEKLIFWLPISINILLSHRLSVSILLDESRLFSVLQQKHVSGSNSNPNP